MALDQLSPTAPARIRALLLPVGRIKRSRFLSFVELLQPQCMIRLGDISPDPRPDRNMFSPLAFPGGILLYDLSTSLPPRSHTALSPFELFREPLLVIGIGDAAEYAWSNESRADDEPQDAENANAEVSLEDEQEIESALDNLREEYPRAYHHTVMMFDCPMQTNRTQLPKGMIHIPPVAQQKTTTMKTILCDITSTLLAEMTTLARSIQALPTVLSPASQSTDGTQGTPNWASSDSMGSPMGRRNSQVTTTSRPGSPLSQKELHRMSMPVLPSASNSLNADDPRTSPSASQGTRTPPTTFDDMPGVISSGADSTSKPPPSNARDKSADRVSIHGFGSGGVGERARNKGRGRVSIVIGTLYLCAGQWHDALRELTEGASRARAFSDHLWHGKALENILVCLLLFAWSGMDFQIPSVCFPTTDKSGVTKSPQHTPSSSVADIASLSNPTSHDVALESLNSLIPDLVHTILNIYTRAANFAGEALPPLAFSECIIRFSKLLTAMNLSAGFLDEDALRHLIQNTPFRQKPKLSVPRLSVNPTRNDIAALLFRALPAPAEAGGLNPTDRVVILAGIASVLSALGLQRKKAIIMKEFITSLIPGLVQARKVGAAEMGVHPAAGLAALNLVSGSNPGAGAFRLGEGEVESGIDEFLGLLGRIYGIPGSRGSFVSFDSFAQYGPDKPRDADTAQLVVEEILKTSSLRSFGSLGLKIDILRMCISFCEALPDFNGLLHFTSLLLRIAGPGTAPKANSTDVFVSLPRDEQVRLYANITRTVAAANKLGMKNIQTSYWDDFLVRGIHIVEEPAHLRLSQHRPTELESTSGKQGPFIHNPWMKQSTTSAAETILVANEPYQFVIALQNPYDFELDIEHLKLAADGVEFAAHEQYFLLGPYRTQKFPITGIARSAGALTVKGCYVKVAGCREQFFPTFADPWKPEREIKMKKIGLSACISAPVSRPASSIDHAVGSRSPVAPKPETLAFTVIPDQPLLAVASISLPQGAVMVLEGERKRFSITVQNKSRTTAVDFVHVTFEDSASAALQAATTNKDLPAAELHELEVQLANQPSIRWCKPADRDTVVIEPGASAAFDIEVVGRTRLTDAVVHINYACIGKRHSEVEEQFFTRQVSVPISITVNASVQLQRPDIVPLSGDFAWTSKLDSERGEPAPLQALSPPISSAVVAKRDAYFQAFLRQTRKQEVGAEYCMLLLDLRNSWPNPLSISLQVCSNTSTDNNAEDPWSTAYTVNEIIQPGHVNRVVLILPKIYLKEPHAAVPSLNPANQRQFVVSASKISPEAERASREAFWYRQELLKLVRGTWKEESNGRHGDIELRTIRFSPRMVEAIKLDDVMFQMSIISDKNAGAGDDVAQVSQAKFHVPVDEFLTLKTKIYNRSRNPISPLLRLQPHLAHLPHDVALDLDKRFSWTGVLQRKLPVIQPGQAVESELGIVALSAGVYEIGATVEEIELLPRKNEEQGEEIDGNRPRKTSSVLEGNILGEPKLRVWHMKEPCTVVAKRKEV